MRQIHVAGEKLFVDYAGDTVAIVDAATGEITQAQIFVAVLGASNFTFACATPRQTTADWIDAQVQALEFIAGVPRLIVPDQPRALVKTPDRYDPELNATYAEFTQHYGCTALPARPAHPRDKPKVEGSVLLVQRWILARLRNRRFFSLGAHSTDRGHPFQADRGQRSGRSRTPPVGCLSDGADGRPTARHQAGTPYAMCVERCVPGCPRGALAPGGQPGAEGV
jgi:transposase